MLNKNEYYGLCSNCSNVYDCVFLHNTDQVIFQCEEYIAVKVEKTCESGDVLKKSSSFKNLCISVKYKGLCINCENRESCGLSSTEGGVWHCEEYK